MPRTNWIKGVFSSTSQGEVDRTISHLANTTLMFFQNQHRFVAPPLAEVCSCAAACGTGEYENRIWVDTPWAVGGVRGFLYVSNSQAQEWVACKRNVTGIKSANPLRISKGRCTNITGFSTLVDVFPNKTWLILVFGTVKFPEIQPPDLKRRTPQFSPFVVGVPIMLHVEGLAPHLSGANEKFNRLL